MKKKYCLFLLTLLVSSFSYCQVNDKSNLFLEYKITYNLGKELTKTGYLFEFENDKYFFTTKSNFKEDMKKEYYNNEGNHRFITLKSAGDGSENIWDNVSSGELLKSESIGNKIIKTKENSPKIKWRRTEKSMIIMDQECYLYETSFRGRVYYAYVSLELNYNFGPWKFSDFEGIPMLIYDSDNNVKWELTSIKNYDSKKLVAFAENVQQKLNSLEEMNLPEFVVLKDNTKGGLLRSNDYLFLPADYQKMEDEDEPFRKSLELIYEWEQKKSNMP